MSSESALNIPKEMIRYGMTKAAQPAVSRGLAETVAGTGVTVNAVLPGPTASERLVARLGGGPDEAGRRFVAEHRPSSLLGRLIAPEEVANMVVHACSPRRRRHPGRRCGWTAGWCVR